MECEPLRFKPIRCTDMQIILDLPCQKVQWSTINKFPETDPSSNFEKWRHHAHNVLLCAGYRKYNIYPEGWVCAVYEWRKNQVKYFFKFNPIKTLGGSPLPTHIAEYDLVNPKCYYMGKTPIPWDRKNLFLSPWPFFFLMFDSPMTANGLPDVPHQDLLKVMSVEAQDKLYTTEEKQVIADNNFARWYYDMEYQYCKQKWENVTRSIMIKGTGQPGTLESIMWGPTITKDLTAWLKRSPAQRAKEKEGVAKTFTYMVKPLYGPPVVTDKAGFTYTD